MQRQMRVIQGIAPEARPRSGIESAYDHFRLERQGELVSQSTLEHYDYMVLPFLDWLRREQPEVRRFEDLDVVVVRENRAVLAAGRRRDGRQLAARPVFDGHRALLTFFRWAEAQGYRIDSRILALKRPRVPVKEPTVYHVAQVRQILGACNPKLPQEELAVRILVGSGIRESELCGLAVVALDRLPDLMLDSVARGEVRPNRGQQGVRRETIVKTFLPSENGGVS